ncbi:Re/Si-specific NAD(P)(+) transhydrogenase subunit alpha [Pseudanabaena sp. FACHB-2040]|uniref:Re/Si-specific NAD(P)(+) transhydrogenase subunit alpha n=1 Tax=Pseudanabaena sp. FACHB-2040 TaxID=2692859 RepID=UPI001682F268|nr:Re/Si-specific NAD(P)(+) transhydrogenase subunit alpha [Pseudanabaena sp. FACHB-2040]MBD2260328.1 Re/Si-specific NAD(P)(+) transhydrogenase subunit alpha [Pseudanabaena sp. FACHB-2040]
MTIATELETSLETQSAGGNQPKRVGIPKEVFAGESRVAATPETAKKLQKLGFEVLIESGAGEAASFPDAAYAAVGCEILPDPQSIWQQADIVLKVRPPIEHPTLGTHEADLLPAEKTLISFIWPAQNPDLMGKLAERRATVLAMDLVPRISRAQKMDALSSMANIAGYRAVIEAANQFGRCFTGQITAAGKMPPARVLVIGAGVAGLAAIGTARSLGAVVKAFDTRPAVKEQVQSLGAEFLELHFQEDGSGTGGYAKEMSPAFIAAEMALFAQQAREVDIIVTTALIPGKKAPLLITRDMVESMKPGSVVVDMAAEQGGNCEVTQPGEVSSHSGVRIVGLTDLPSRMASQASQLYGTNLYHLLHDLGGSAQYNLNFEDEVIRGTTVMRAGEVTWPAPRPAPLPAQEKPMAQNLEEGKSTDGAAQPDKGWLGTVVWTTLITLALIAVGFWAPDSFLSHLTVFVLSIFLGWKVIWDVAPALHTPLMSVTNAISGIIIIGGMLQISSDWTSPVTILGAIAVVLGMVNVAGGFMVTQRMLNMFHR